MAEIVAQNGFTVIPVNGKTPATPRWPNSKPTNREWLAWAAASPRYADCGLGIVCGRVVAVDLDADNAELLARYEALAAEHIGLSPYRRLGRPLRALLLYRPAEGEYIPTTSAGRVEIKSHGTQFAAYGEHPDTGLEYRWDGECPAYFQISDLPTITAAAIRAFCEAVARLHQTPVPARAAVTSGPYGLRIKRDSRGLVVDGREAFLAKIVAAVYASDKAASAEQIARITWEKFTMEADLSRPKGSNRHRHWQYRDALTKAKSTVRRRPNLAAPRRRRDPIPDLTTWHRPWSPEQRQAHVAAVAARWPTAAVMLVQRAMMDGLDPATGLCTLALDEIAKRANCSRPTVVKARRWLHQIGFWLPIRGGVFIPIPEA